LSDSRFLIYSGAVGASRTRRGADTVREEVAAERWRRYYGLHNAQQHGLLIHNIRVLSVSPSNYPEVQLPAVIFRGLSSNHSEPY
jgi:hypothetical protein